jgi:CRP-like cAMP-binding protein
MNITKKVLPNFYLCRRNKIMVKTSVPKNNKCHDCLDKSCATEILGENELELITNNRYISDIKKKTNILNAGYPTSHIIYLRSGLVKEYLIKPDNNEQILQIILPHSYIGLTSLFGDKVNHYSYTALTDLRVCYIDIDVFTQMIKSNGNFAFEILSSVGRESLYNFHRFIAQSNKKTYGRIADMLIYFSRVVFSSTKFQLPLSRREVADMVGTSRESTGRVLSKFNDEEIISISGKNIIINNIKKLEKISKLG